QHLLILGKLWMQKHGVILDMSCDKLAFWPGHCQHPVSLSLVVNTLVESHLSTSAHFKTSATVPLTPHMKNPTTSMTAPAELQKSKKLIKIPLASSGVQPAYRGISKLADGKGEKYVVPAKRILKPTTPKPKAELVDETKLLDLAFIDAALF
ncbi:hypothetical protein MMC22_007628, partial [Lobaria immixta]|nr:hypothetical protein [Lobaria immixta]